MMQIDLSYYKFSHCKYMVRIIQGGSYAEK